MRVLAVFTVAALLGLAGQEEEPDPVGEALVACAPATLGEAMNCLDAHWPAREEYRALSYEDTIMAHMGFGMWMRNEWSLWGGGPLAEYFNGLGISHPDDMSGIILKSYWLRLNGCPIRLDEQVAYYRGFWERAEAEEGEDDYVDTKPNLDCTAQTGANAQ